MRVWDFNFDVPLHVGRAPSHAPLGLHSASEEMLNFSHYCMARVTKKLNRHVQTETFDLSFQAPKYDLSQLIKCPIVAF